MKTISWVIVWVMILAFRLVSAAPSVVISEFMAINTTTLADEDGDYSDWIELYNSSTNSVNLGGWYLTDRATNLTHWKFPSTNLGPSSFMVVFASNKNRRVAGAPLHTNFKLAGSGEYLALVMPDGVTKATEFAPAFPPQYADISYGYAMTGAVRTLVAPNAAVRALVPSCEIDPGWRLVGFDDSTWALGTLGRGLRHLGQLRAGDRAGPWGSDAQFESLRLSSRAFHGGRSLCPDAPDTQLALR